MLSTVDPKNSTWSIPIEVIIEISESIMLVASSLPPKPTSKIAKSKSS